ncbi:MAG: hypothetical protein KAS32_13675 [Candidatus Peribacteraceae bacterium]|nr:hypothetical protein [Candidatus Peribacteraceae bacterium]
MAVELTDGTDTVTFDVIKNITPVVVKDLNMLETPHGTVAIDKGRTGNALSLDGTQYTSGYANMEQINDFTGNEVALSGMPDSNHDGDYFIVSLHFMASEGYPADMYDFNIELERARD